MCILSVVVCMCERLTPDTLSTQTEAQDDANNNNNNNSNNINNDNNNVMYSEVIFILAVVV